MFRTILITASLAGAIPALSQDRPPTTTDAERTQTSDAQRTQTNDAQRARAATHVLLSQLRDATVTLSVPSRRESTSTTSRTGAVGSGQTGEVDRTTTPDGRSKLRVKDVVLSTANGELTAFLIGLGAAPAVGEQSVLVPASAMRWQGNQTPGVTGPATNQSPPVFALDMSAAQVESLPPFEMDRTDRTKLDRTIEGWRASTSTGRNEVDTPRENDATREHSDGGARGDTSGTSDASRGGGSTGGGDSRVDSQDGQRTTDAGARGPAEARGVGAKPMLPAPRHVFASAITNNAVAATERDFGRLHDATIDPDRKVIDYVVVVPSAGKTFIAPFSAMAWSETPDGKLRLVIPRSVEELQNAPEFKKGETAPVSDESFEQADRFFGVRTPARAD